MVKEGEFLGLDYCLTSDVRPEFISNFVKKSSDVKDDDPYRMTLIRFYYDKDYGVTATVKQIKNIADEIMGKIPKISEEKRKAEKKEQDKRMKKWTRLAPVRHNPKSRNRIGDEQRRIALGIGLIKEDIFNKYTTKWSIVKAENSVLMWELYQDFETGGHCSYTYNIGITDEGIMAIGHLFNTEFYQETEYALWHRKKPLKNRQKYYIKRRKILREIMIKVLK